MKSVARHRDDATFDLTAMIDVVLLLIIFFMMTTQFARSEHAAMNLPGEKGEEGAPETGRTVFIDLAVDGALSMMHRPVTLEEAADAVRAAAGNGTSAEVRVVVRADRDAPASAFSAVCAALSRAGIRSVSLGTSAEGGAP